MLGQDPEFEVDVVVVLGFNTDLSVSIMLDLCTGLFDATSFTLVELCKIVNARSLVSKNNLYTVKFR